MRSRLVLRGFPPLALDLLELGAVVIEAFSSWRVACLGSWRVLTTPPLTIAAVRYLRAAAFCSCRSGMVKIMHVRIQCP